ncbi:hypothetical protein E3J48_08220 [Candidatus Aerophobetes bacterium]|uniref:Uncharacterized protein n=1 Tax=Aerophobetes bacterium TaxID=2030807 RepID=A0A523VWK6_UNCAE|nr:MAG: hypothetical protein E3J48_08220 [Candidatus Aerophobetes bacterium]
MTNQEIRCAILKYIYDEKKAGNEFAMAVVKRITKDYKVDIKRVRSIFLRDLPKEGLIETRSPWGTSATDAVITEKGIREYMEKCKGG